VEKANNFQWVGKQEPRRLIWALTKKKKETGGKPENLILDDK